MRTLLLAALLLLPSAAKAGPALALRLGYATASGDASKGTPMTEVAKSAVPIQLDALWRFGPSFSAGAYFSYGFARLSSGVTDQCDALGASCSASTMRFGVEGLYELHVSRRFTPWFGLGVGYEWVREKVSLGAVSAAQDVSGWEYFNLQAGADAKVSGRFAIGPYAMYSVGRLSRLDGYAIVNQRFHEWLSFGVRGKLEL